MKKILIVNNNLHIGGVQKALVSLLWQIRTEYDITLVLFSPSGAYKEELPPEVKVITPKSGYRYLGMTRRDATKWIDKLGRAFYAGISRVLGRKYAIGLMGHGQKQLQGFDAAISYLHNSQDKAFYGGCNDFVLKHVSAKKKITFLHCDFSLCGANTPDNKKQYEKFDQIAACSQGCADAFSRINPHLSQRIIVVPNCHEFEKIRKKAEDAPVQMPADKINIVTVARLGKEKGVERAVRVIAGLGDLKEKIHYCIIGDGTQMPVIRDVIEKENLSQNITLCGAQTNPYGYMKAADLLLIPSYSEAAPLVIGESVCLGTPVLSTKTSSAEEMVQDTGYGWVCENDEDALRQSLVQLLEDGAALKEKKKQLQKRNIGNETAVSQFAKLISC